MNTRLLYLSYFITQIGSWSFRIGLIVGLLQSSISSVGIGVAVIFAPIIIGGVLLSPIVDKFDQLTAMIIINIVRALILISLIFIPNVDSIEVYLSVALLSIFQPVYMSAQVSFLRSVSAPDEIVSALRNISNVEWLTYILGMSLGAVLISQLSLDVILMFNIGALLISSGVIVFIKRSSPSAFSRVFRPKSATLEDLKPLYPIFLAIFLLNLGAGIVNVYPAVRATVGSETDQGVLTTIIVANGIFGLLGALSVRPIYKRLGALTTMSWAAFLIVVALAGMALDGGLALAVVSSSAMLGLGQVFAVSAQTYMIESVSELRAGQLSGLFQCCTFGGVAVNGVFFSFLSAELGFSSIVIMCAVSSFLAFCISVKQLLRYKPSINSRI